VLGASTANPSRRTRSVNTDSNLHGLRPWSFETEETNLEHDENGFFVSMPIAAIQRRDGRLLLTRCGNGR
jgi:hypothetical protein